MNHSLSEQLQAAIAPFRSAIDYLEIRIEQSEATTLSFRGPHLEAVDRNLGLVGGIRHLPRPGTA